MILMTGFIEIEGTRLSSHNLCQSHTFQLRVTVVTAFPVLVLRAGFGF